MKNLISLSAILLLFFFPQKRKQETPSCESVIALVGKTKEVCEKYPTYNHCNVFVGMAVRDIYGFDDFINNKSPSGYYIANEVGDMLFTTLSEKWESLGTCSEQKNLDKAQSMANSNHAVLAVWRNPDNKKHGHVALVLPGSQKAGWKGMIVPNAASFAQGAAELNFVCDRLSGAFGIDKISAVYLFARK